MFILFPEPGVVIPLRHHTLYTITYNPYDVHFVPSRLNAQRSTLQCLLAPSPANLFPHGIFGNTSLEFPPACCTR